MIEAFNHKVNHDSHKELGTQECAVLQYARTLQYVSYCNDERYKDRLAPAVKAFWSEVAEPFGSRALHNLDLLHILGKAMRPNWGAKIPDYGVWDHIAQICAPFFLGIESHSQYEIRWHQWEEECGHIDASGDYRSPSRGPERRTQEWEDRPDAPKPSRLRSKSRHRQNVREQWSCSRKRALSWTPWGGSPHDSSSSRGWKLPTPPWPPRSETSKKAEAQQMAFRDAMEVAWSPPMTWEDQVQEEEECERHSSTGGDSQPCPSSPPFEGCNVSDVSMAEEGPQQCDSDMIVEEEREESMETDAPLDSAAPTLLKEKGISEDLKAKVEEDHRSQTSEESTDQNLPHDSDPDKDKLLGLPADISVPRGHSDNSITLIISPGDDNL